MYRHNDCVYILYVIHTYVYVCIYIYAIHIIEYVHTNTRLRLLPGSSHKSNDLQIASNLSFQRFVGRSGHSWHPRMDRVTMNGAVTHSWSLSNGQGRLKNPNFWGGIAMVIGCETTDVCSGVICCRACWKCHLRCTVLNKPFWSLLGPPECQIKMNGTNLFGTVVGVRFYCSSHRLWSSLWARSQTRYCESALWKAEEHDFQLPTAPLIPQYTALTFFSRSQATSRISFSSLLHGNSSCRCDLQATCMVVFVQPLKLSWCCGFSQLQTANGFVRKSIDHIIYI